MTRFIGCVLAVVAFFSVWGCWDEFEGFLGYARSWRQGDPYWFGLTATGLITAGCSVLILATAGLSYLILFRSKPEHFVLEGWRLLYGPGSVLNAVRAGDAYDRMVLWSMVRGGKRFEVSKDRFGGASITWDGGRPHVLVQAGDRQWHVASFLDSNEQQWLMETLNEWKRRG